MPKLKHFTEREHCAAGERIANIYADLSMLRSAVEDGYGVEMGDVAGAVQHALLKLKGRLHDKAGAEIPLRRGTSSVYFSAKYDQLPCISPKTRSPEWRKLRGREALIKKANEGEAA